MAESAAISNHAIKTGRRGARRFRQRLIVFAAIGGAMFLYRHFFHHRDAFNNSPWDRKTNAALRAMHECDWNLAAGLLDEAMSEAIQYGSRDVRVGTTFHNIGLVRIQQKKYAEADTALVKSVEILRAQRAGDNEELPAVLENLAAVRIVLQRPDEAVKLMDEAIGAMPAFLRRRPEMVARLRSKSAALLAAGKYKEAAAIAVDAQNLEDSICRATTSPISINRTNQ